MCTLVLLQRPGELLAVSGNRNELLSRPASGPSVSDGVLAPHDDLAGGSWLGLNRHGLFVCVTNRRGGMVDPSRKSRGLLVIEALKAHSASGLRAAMEELHGDRHNGFHLIYADLRDAFVTFFQKRDVWRMIAFAFLTAYVLRRTAFGRHVYATGDDPESAQLVGIHVDRTLVAVYTLAGFLCSVAAWILIGRIGAVSPNAGATANLDSITAAVIGGTSLFGGRGSITGTLFGALIVGVFRNGLALAGLQNTWQELTVGLLIIVAVALDQWIRRLAT